MEKIFIKPAPGIKLFDPVTNKFLPAAGLTVNKTPFWSRRIAEGSAIRVEKNTATAAPAAGQPEESAAAAPAAPAATDEAQAAPADPAGSEAPPETPAADDPKPEKKKSKKKKKN